MKRSSVNKNFLAAVALVLLLGASSCNRGTGCPNNFSVKSVFSLVQAIF